MTTLVAEEARRAVPVNERRRHIDDQAIGAF